MTMERYSKTLKKRRKSGVIERFLNNAVRKVTEDNNLEAGKFFEWNNWNNAKWKKEIGTYVLTMKNVNCPVFLSGMISGQRALDIFSKERLIWHMKKVLHG